MLLDTIFPGLPLREKIAFLLIVILLLINFIIPGLIIKNRHDNNEVKYWLIANVGMSVLTYLIGEGFASLSLAIYHRQISSIVLDGIHSQDLAHYEHSEEQIANVIRTAYTAIAALGIMSTFLLWLIYGKSILRRLDDQS